MSVHYIGVNDMSRSNCQQLNSYYSENFPIPNKNLRYTEGRSASVYDICKNKNCSYVLKVIFYGETKQVGYIKMNF